MSRGAILLTAALAALLLVPYALQAAPTAAYAVAIDTSGTDRAAAALVLPDGTVALVGEACSGDALIAFYEPGSGSGRVYVVGQYSKPPAVADVEEMSAASGLAPGGGGVVVVGAYLHRPFFAEAGARGVGALHVVEKAGGYRVRGLLQAVAPLGDGGYVAAGAVRLSRYVLGEWERVGSYILVVFLGEGLEVRGAYLVDIKGGGEEQVSSIVVAGDAVYIGGSTRESYGDGFLLKMGVDGTPDWVLLFSSPQRKVSTDYVLSVAAGGDGVLVAGYYTVSEGYRENGFAVYVTPGGRVEWSVAASLRPLTRATAAVGLPGGGFIVAVKAVKAEHMVYETYLVRLSGGEPVEAVALGVPGFSGFVDVAALSPVEGGLLVGGALTRKYNAAALAVAAPWPLQDNISYVWEGAVLLRYYRPSQAAAERILGGFGAEPPRVSQGEAEVKKVELTVTQEEPVLQDCGASVEAARAEAAGSAGAGNEAVEGGSQQAAPQQPAQQAEETQGGAGGENASSRPAVGGGAEEAPAPAEPAPLLPGFAVYGLAALGVVAVAAVGLLVLRRRGGGEW